MTVPINDRRIQYTATSGQTNFAVPFVFFAVADLKVYNGTTLLTYNNSPSSASQYSVTGAGVTGKAIQKGYGSAKYATTTPSGLLFFGAPVTYMAGKYFLGDGTEIKGKDLEKIEKRCTS